MDQNDLELLQMVPLYHLQAIAKACHLSTTLRVFSTAISASSDLSATPSTPVVLEMAHYLLDATSIGEMFNELDEFEVSLLLELLACGGRANSRDLALYFQGAAPLGTVHSEEMRILALNAGVQIYQPGTSLQPPRYPVPHPHGTFEQAVHHLLLLGCVFWGKQTHFVGRDYASGMHDGLLIVPQTILNAARRKWHAEAPSLPDSSVAGRIVQHDERLAFFQRRLYRYWSFVAGMRGGLTLINNGLLSRTGLRQMIDHMNVPSTIEPVRLESDHAQLLFIRLLLIQLGLLRVRQNALIAAPAETFFSLPLYERVQLCYHAYRDSDFWNELLYLPEINVRPIPEPLTPAHEEILRARCQVIERLLIEPPAKWHQQAALIARAKLHIPYLLFPRQYGPRAERYSQGCNPYGWDFRLRRGWLTHREGWHMVEGGFMRAMLTGPLAWMQLVQLDQEKLSSTFQISEAGALIMRDVPLQLAEEDVQSNRLIVQPNFDLVVLAPVSEGLLVRLDRFADCVNLEHIAQYRVSKASVTRAVQHGLSASDLLVLLELNIEGDIPQNVRYSLEEWERQARRVEIWPHATLLEVEDSALLDRFFADPSLSVLFRRRLTQQLVEVVPEKLSEVQQLLWQQNELPAYSTATNDSITSGHTLSAHEPQWHLHEDGTLSPVYAVLDFYLIAEALLFCDRSEQTGGLRITAASLQRALASDISLEQIIAFLQSYCADGIPGSFLIRLKLWGGGYAATQCIHVEQAPLLRLSADVLRDLQADPEVASLLGSEVAAEQRLVHIDVAQLAQLLKLLEIRGFLTNAQED
ncbi:helicase-associated domain-containing protein [Dictyobacter arantiisoli]|uniref:Helicase XPB/Ssl2 N-terminal domain-containing protein n=1 Tax=Dictyobacter arantiisoli TaxID=2014874 RepID=A0A5A5TFI6_9CHLR|nr:helicase-associated domain-containing protein [Dictyobacter arantiisoli]GCF10182.1 hypothetical protein KDI_37460 [Dictyobacter arantiisoli]